MAENNEPPDPTLSERRRAAEERDRIRRNGIAPHHQPEILNKPRSAGEPEHGTFARYVKETQKGSPEEAFGTFDEYASAARKKGQTAEDAIAPPVKPPPEEKKKTGDGENGDDSDISPSMGNSAHWQQREDERKRSKKKTREEIEEQNRMQQELATQRVQQQAWDWLAQQAASIAQPETREKNHPPQSKV